MYKRASVKSGQIPSHDAGFVLPAQAAARKALTARAHYCRHNNCHDNKVYNREDELEFLGEEHKNGGFRFISVTGRRRVGKTALMEKFMSGKKALYFFVPDISGTSRKSSPPESNINTLSLLMETPIITSRQL